MNDFSRKLHDVRQRIAVAAAQVGRRGSDVTLVAVSKKQPNEAVQALRNVGQIDFGESRAQELTKRLGEEPLAGARWHFIGRLQTNKVNAVVSNATLIHSVDRVEVAEAIAATAERIGTVQRVLMQVNVSEDPNKGGFVPDVMMANLVRLRRLSHLSVEGLMTIPALDADPDEAFATLQQLRDDAREQFPEVVHLSMGMSHDYESAVKNGATMVRVGTTLFGERP